MNLREKKLFLLDMDGTLYLDETLFPSVPEFLSHIRDAGGRYLFLTNNSSRGAADYVEKLRRLGIAAGEEDFLTSVDALLYALRREGLMEKRLYVFGTASLRAHLAQAGCRLASGREDAQVLVCGFDTELTFQKLEDACILLGRGVPYLATNPDWVCPTWYGYVPDCGSVCEMLWRATGRRPLVAGKPQPEMVLLAMERTGFSPAETLVVGDRLYTDIACGVNAGVDTALVLSGESTRETLAASDVQPTWVLRDVAELLEQMQREEQD